jgi:hypothetical protein
MKSLCYVLMVVLCFIGACATGDHQNQAALSDPGPFDGAWDVTYVCKAEQGGDSYTMRLKAFVKDSVFHGKYEAKDTGAFLTLDGKIKSDGSALITADGDTGRDEKHVIASSRHYNKTSYNYNINANFTKSRATGKRITGRSCDLTAVKRSK